MSTKACRSKSLEYRREYQRRYQAEHREAWRKGQREYYATNPERVAAWKERRRFRAAIYRTIKAAEANGYAPCLTDVGAIRAAFTGDCQICSAPESKAGTRLSLDHDHSTGAFRGWLCRSCNSLLGSAKDSPVVLLKAAKYLSRPFHAP